MDSIRKSVEEAKDLSSTQPVIFVDTRNPQAWGKSEEKLPGAVRIPLDELESRIDELDRKANIITYCT